MLRIELPWPDARLSPNARKHHQSKARHAATAKEAAYVLTIAAGAKFAKFASDRLAIETTFYPPDKRRRDLDNLQASMKAAYDGIALALMVDDSQWVKQTQQWGERRKGGAVIVTISDEGE